MNSISDPTGKLPISVGYERACEARARERSSYFSNGCKDDREWMILGAACELMQKASSQPPHFAIKSEGPDFQIFDERGLDIGGIEIAEVLRLDDTRHKRFKNAEKAGPQKPRPLPPPLVEPWKPLRMLLHKKAAKAYPANTILLVYFDIWLYAFSDLDKPVHIQLIEEHLRSPFEGCDRFREVLVLDSGMKSLIRLHPHPNTIFPS
jgi:hypothetical protein